MLVPGAGRTHTAAMVRLLLLSLSAFGLAACGDKTFSPGTASPASATQEPASSAEAEKAEEQKNISQELLDKLKATTDEAEATMLEEEIWEAWLISGSATVDTLMKRGLEYQESEDLEAARDAFDKAIAIKPDYAEAWNRRAVLFFNDGKYDEAIADLESAITYEPRHFGAWIGLAMIFESVDRPDAALKAYDKALEFHPMAQAAVQGKRRLDRVVNGRAL
jgi:tetratricopeptide (TPR) repeat protein